MKIRYTNQDGNTYEIKISCYQENVEIEVSKEVFEGVKDFEREASNRKRKEARHHFSLEYMISLDDYDAPDPDADPTRDIEQRERIHALQNAIEMLLPQQQELVRKVYFENRTLTSIAREEGVGESAIRDRLLRIMNKMRTFLA